MSQGPGHSEPVVIDGARGEGGGQILRTSLALSMITGRPLHMQRIRAGRAKPGLRRQHLACIEAAAQLCQAEVRGGGVGSQELVFTPGAITGGEMEIDIGTAGSTTLVVQTIAVPAIAAGVALRAVIRGGTHNPLAPPFEFLERVWRPHLQAMGAKISLALDRHGFASGGEPAEPDRAAERANGQLTLEIGAGGALGPIDLVETGPVASRRATAILSRLPSHVAEREHAIVRERLGFSAAECEVREVRGAGPANVLLIELERAGGRELVSAFGEKGLRAERVAQHACDDAAAFLAADVPVGAHLADQLLLPLAIAGGGRFRSMPLSLHATTNIATIREFLDVAIEAAPDSPIDRSHGGGPPPHPPRYGFADRAAPSPSVVVTVGRPGRLDHL
ncbi:MAG TPA: RNA 3'-terminal phosphate cyclase [Kofleriaceae bacterium]